MFRRRRWGCNWAKTWSTALIALSFGASPALAADPACDDPRVGDLTPTAEGLTIARAAAPGVRVQDVLLQLNGRRLRNCGDLATAVQEAERQQLVPVMLLRRGDELVTLALTVPTQTPLAVSSPTVSVDVAAPATPPPVPPPLHDDSARTEPLSGDAARAEMLDAMRAFDRQITLPLLTPQPFDQRVRQLRQTYDRLRGRSDAMTTFEPILRYYVTVAEILAYKDGTSPQKLGDERTSVMGIARGRYALGSYEYVGDGAVQSWLDRYPFLGPSVIRTPGPSFVGPLERSGEWKPDEAIQLLIERARAELAQSQ